MASSSSAQPSSTVPFPHTAAGHAGISTSADGTLLIKPCTPSEIAFYEAARQHPNFQAHMPVYMGSLTLNDNPGEQAAVNALRSAQTRRDSKGAEDAATEPEFGRPKRRQSGHIVSDPIIKGSSSKKEWTPSGGAKLSSNLSIVLSNATAGFVKPNIIDLKLGARLWDDDAPTPKRAKLDEVANTSTSGSLGFRVAGMKVYVGEDATDNVVRDVNTTISNGYKTYDKFYGRSNIHADGENITTAFEEFLHSLSISPTNHTTNGPDNTTKIDARRKLLLQRLLRETESIQFALENEESRMYSASILMVYEGDPDALDSVITYTGDGTSSSPLAAAPKPGVDPIYTTASHEERAKQKQEQDIEDVEEEEDMEAVDVEEDDEDELKQKIHEVVLIDFAHAKFLPGSGSDENSLRGVRSVRAILESLIN